MNANAWGLRKKILLSMVSLLLLLGLSTVLITRTILLSVLKTDFQHKGLSYARTVAANGVVDVLTQNTSRLKRLVENEKDLDSSIAYVFVADPQGRVLAHTFKNGFPIDLITANNFQKGRVFNIQILDTQLGFIYDIAVGIFSEKTLLGQAHVGVLQNNIQRTINMINLIFAMTTILAMLIGIFMASKISSLITKPISRLVAVAQSIQKGDFSTRIDINSKDEIGLLASAFNEMASCLRQMVNQIKRFAVLEERNRIALDLHDGCAQNLASIIKRIELCEKLFKIDPAEASKELRFLEDNTRDILDKTRQVIFDLKSQDKGEFNLVEKLRTYLKDYERINCIAVKMDIFGPLDNIPARNIGALFYIITEALNNVRKHSLAKNVMLNMGSDNHDLKIVIRDDGRGFNADDEEISGAQRRKYGLANMRQRADSMGGRLVISSALNKGSEVIVEVPLEQAA